MTKPVDETKNAAHTQPSFTAELMRPFYVCTEECVQCGEGALFMDRQGALLCGECEPVTRYALLDITTIVDIVEGGQREALVPLHLPEVDRHLKEQNGRGGR